jgi:hypothetical protein
MVCSRILPALCVSHLLDGTEHPIRMRVLPAPCETSGSERREAQDPPSQVGSVFSPSSTRHSRLASCRCLVTPLESAFTCCDGVSPLESVLTQTTRGGGSPSHQILKSHLKFIVGSLPFSPLATRHSPLATVSSTRHSPLPLPPLTERGSRITKFFRIASKGQVFSRPASQGWSHG